MEGVRILIDSPYDRTLFKEHIFYPGDQVTGKVVLVLAKDEEIRGVDVDFKGKLHFQQGRGQNDYVYETLLFGFSQTLFQGPFKMRKDTYEYPFSFTFPETWNNPSNPYRDDKKFSQLKSVVGEHPLPPSCKDLGMYAESEVYYRITASVPRTFNDWEDKVTLTFSPFRLELEPDLKIKTVILPDHHHRNFRLTDEGRPRELSVGETIKHGFHRSSETHTINFTLSAEAPTRIIIGNSYPIFVTLNSNDTGLKGIEPEFLLKTYNLKLKGRTDIRLPGIFKDVSEVLGTPALLSNGNLNAALPINEPTPIHGMFPKIQEIIKLIVPPPSFVSVAMKVTYVLELKLVLDCLGEETSLKIEWPDVEVLAGRVGGKVAEAFEAVEGKIGSDGESSSVLPVYEKHGGEGLPGYETTLKS